MAKNKPIGKRGKAGRACHRTVVSEIQGIGIWVNLRKIHYKNERKKNETEVC
jgi:hypothetical protein